MFASWWVVLDSGTSKRRIVPVHDRLVVGRECVGVAPDRRLILDEPTISRNHFEIRIARGGDATLRDASTNGTRVNETMVQRGARVSLSDGDVIELGGHRLVMRFSPGDAGEDDLVRSTIRQLERGALTVVAGDPLGELTPREREVLALVAQGSSNAAIAERLVLSPRTVDNHIRRIMQALALPETSDDNRRVHAVLTYLRAVARGHAEPAP